MSRPTQARRSIGKILGVIASLLAILGVITTSGGSALAAQDTGGKARGNGKGDNNLYIIQMLDAPVVAYTGDLPGLKATKPKQGQKINPNSPDVVKYVTYLDGKHDAKVNGVGGRKVYSYRYAFNGFAAELTPAQVTILRADPEVIAVAKDTLAQRDTATTPTFLGLDAPNGIWSKLSGNTSGSPISPNGPNSGGAGEGVIVGIIDSGIWPENPSFSDRDAAGKLVFQQIPGWNGRCVPGDEFTAANCNQKLIGAQYFNAGYGGNAGIDAEFPYEFNSPRDADGHGSHTASTAAGNYGVPVVVDGTDFGTISGMAPRARVAVYKTCWGNGGEGGCFNTDNVAAIDQAVADGVDVINFSISGTRTNFLDPVEVAFLFAADAGVFVAASAGNSGPTASTVAHPSPWITTVAASTHSRAGLGSVTVNGTTYEGASLATSPVSAPLVYGGNAAKAGASSSEAALCFPGTLDPSVVTGKIVVCDRGVIGRTEKSYAVKVAQGVGMILVNISPNSINADLHFVPTVHLDADVRAAILAYAGTPGATAAINAATLVENAPAPFMADFSSRGPLLAADGDLLKPDITAPGVDVLAAVSPIGYRGRSYDFLSGTSMSSPHMAGIAALMKDLYPTWTPMMIKSALMTTGSDVLDGPNTDPDVIFGQGAGHVQPNSAMNPGLVYNSGWLDWLAFLCGSTSGVGAATCTTLASRGYSFDPSDLNTPSIAIGSLAGEQTVRRTVTNVSGAPLTVNAAVSGLSGVNAVVSPASLTLAPGQSKTFTVKFTTSTTAELNAYTGGYLTWTGGGRSVRIPLMVKPVALAAPSSVTGSGSPISYNVTFGYSGSFSASPLGLVAPAVTPGAVSQDPDQTFDPADPTGTVAIQVVVPAGTPFARFAIFDKDVAPGSDIDLYVYDEGGNEVGFSATGTSTEIVSLRNPAAGTYTVYIHGWGLSANPSPFKLNAWVVPSTPAGNMTVSAPATATLAGTGTVSLSFSGLAPATSYLGAVTYAGAANMPITIVSVTTP